MSGLALTVGALVINATGLFLVPLALRRGADNSTFTFVRRLGDVGGALAFMRAVNGRSSVLTAFSPSKWGSWPIISVACAIISGVANTGGSLLVQRAQARGMDPGTATSLAALYPALMMILSVDAGFEKLSLLKVCGLLLAAGSGVCFAKDLAR